jgi:hypothetical protein
VFSMSRLIHFLCLAIGLSLLAGCGGGGGTVSAPTTPPGTTPPPPPPSSFTFSVTTLDFGSVTTGTPKTQSVTMTNGGSASVTVTQISASDAEFTLTGVVLPLTLSASQSATATVTFNPAKTGLINATITVSSSTGALGTLPVRGTGLQPLAHSVDVTWTASTSPGVVRYNVYRSTVAGGPYTVIGSVTGTTFTDLNVTAGATYFYVVTSVDSSSIESVVSGERSATVPTP